MDIDELYDIFLHSEGVTTDTRRCASGMIFFALKGASFDGNRFAHQALENGCLLAVVDEAEFAKDGRYVLVDDAQMALQCLAMRHRQEMGKRGLRVLQITGTNGKTTTKELCAAVLGKKHRVLYTEGNLNNHIGVPLTLLRLKAEHDIAVIETGANHPGEIASLTAIVQPDFGLITNVGRAHLEGFGDFEGVKRTKGELYDYLMAHDRPAFLYSESKELVQMAAERGLKSIPYVQGHATGGETFLTVELNCHLTIKTHLVGGYNLPNVLAAITVGLHFGVSMEDAADALRDYVPSNNRSQLVKTCRNTLIVDAYNANPSSMALAVSNFSALRADGKMAIIGDMRELGESSLAEHVKVLEQLCDSDIKDIWLVGDEFSKALALSENMVNSHPQTNVQSFTDVEAVKEKLARHNVSSRTILIKGSNGTRLFQLTDLL